MTIRFPSPRILPFLVFAALATLRVEASATPLLDTTQDAPILSFLRESPVQHSKHVHLSQWDFEVGETAFELRTDWIQPAGQEELLLACLETLEPGTKLSVWWSRSETVQRATLDFRSPGDAFEQIKALDPAGALGLHWSETIQGLPFFQVIPLTGELSVRELRVRLRDSADLDFELLAKDIPLDAFQHEVLASSAGVARDEVIRAGSAEQECEGILAPVSYRSRPRIVVRLRATRSRDFTGQLEWLTVASWEMAAMGFGYVVDQALDETFNTQAAAREIAPGLPTSRHFEEPLYEWVRSEIERDPLEMVDFSRMRAPDDVLRDRRGTDFERALLLASMLSGTGSAVEVVWVSCAEDGRIEMDLPGSGQLGPVLLRVGGSRWYDPGCATCPAGAIRTRFLGGQGLVASRGMATLIGDMMRDLSWQRSFDGKAFARRGAQYYIKQQLREKTWHHWVDIPHLDRGLLREEVVVVPEDRGMFITWSGARGSWVDVNWSARPADDINPGQVLLARQPSATGYEIVNTYETADSVRVSAFIEGLVPPSGDGEWELPGPWLHGNEFLQPWTPTFGCPLHVEERLELHRIVRLPVPGGWGQVVFPRDESESVGELAWSRTARRVGDDIVIEIRLRLDPVHLERVDLQRALSESLERFRALVREPFVMGRGA